ncbi:hypothetical protein SAMN04515665_111106 [Blastococcus sp. DSM 46786]|uniref:DUF5667 domain-containing protein n=1 Tax=Blastococcus sp. DSM 46786 TaxID=1798227 RepID=UPI0008B9F7E1|nr:DUF5667 domain-containing protein [Blastococcus sp. DSM 46786]SEL34696.1 hypothetical protein SAMN04515665_111106 [Blastococcus sp. DSM 46786]
MIRPEDGSTLTGPDTGTAVVARLEALGDRLDTGPDPQYRSRARARLVAMAAVRTPEPTPRPLHRRLLAGRAVDRPPSRWRGRITAGLAGAAVGVTGLAALVAVAAGAQPGDPLYDLKRGTEQTQLALAGDSRGQTLLELAGTRLEELTLLVGTGEPALVEHTLLIMDEHTAQGAGWLTGQAVQSRDAAPLGFLSRWTAEQSGGLAVLADDVPASAAPAYGRSTDLLRALATRVEALRGVLQCPAGPAVVGDDVLGPVPGPCLTDTPAAVVEEPPGAVPPGAGPATGVPPSAAPSAPAVPSAPPAPVGTPADEPTSSATPTPSGLPRPTLPTLPRPPVPSTGSTPRTPPAPVVAVPLPGPLDVCLPPLITVGEC